MTSLSHLSSSSFTTSPMLPKVHYQGIQIMLFDGRGKNYDWLDSQRDIHMKNLHNRTKKKKKQENINIPETNISIKQPEVPFVILYNDGDLPCPESSMVHRCEFRLKTSPPFGELFSNFPSFSPFLFLFSSHQNL
jgi:hypothetical protein